MITVGTYLAARISATETQSNTSAEFQSAIPILRIFSVEKATEFYCDFLFFRWIGSTMSKGRSTCKFLVAIERILSSRKLRLKGWTTSLKSEKATLGHCLLQKGAFDIVLSTFVVHELRNRSDREQLMREVLRVLKPVATEPWRTSSLPMIASRTYGRLGVESFRRRDGFFSFWVSTMLNFDFVKSYHVVGRKTSSV